MKISVETITPARAKQLLANNYDKNRSIRSSAVQQLAAIMERGDFYSENGQTLVVGEDGTLYDGQHRLNAIIESGKSFDMPIAYVEDGEAAFDTLDCGSKRKAADYLYDFSNKNVCGTYASTMISLNYGHGTIEAALGGLVDGAAADRMLVVQYCRDHRDTVEFDSSQGQRMRGSFKCGAPGTYAKFIGFMRFIGEDSRLIEFVDELCDIATTNHAASLTRTTVKDAYLNKRQKPVTNLWLLLTLVCGYRCYIDGKEPKKICSQPKCYDWLTRRVREARSAA